MSDVVNAPAAPAASAANAAPVDNNAAPIVENSAVVDAAGKPATPAPKKETPASLKKKFALKVDGRTEEVELDLGNEEEVKKHLQMSRAAQKRMQQYSEYEKGVRDLFQTLQTDPLKILTDPKLKIPEEVRQKMAQAIINNEIEELQKTPEQRERDKLKREYEALKKQHEEERTQREQAELQRMTEQTAIQLDNDISSAIESSGMPKFWAFVA